MSRDFLLSCQTGFVLLAIVVPARVTSQMPPAPHIVASGYAHIVLPPDWVTFRAGVSATHSAAATASSMATAKAQHVIDTLVALGFARDSIRLVDWGVDPEYDAERQRRTGHTAHGRVEVKVRDLMRLGELVDAVLEAGATRIPSMESRSDSTEVARARALKEAFKDAVSQADALAAAAGGHVGRLVEVSTQPGFPYTVRAVAAQAQGFITGPSITPRDVDVRATVYVRWELVMDQ
jgi:uncharacterized protein YggE